MKSQGIWRVLSFALIAVMLLAACAPAAAPTEAAKPVEPTKAPEPAAVEPTKAPEPAAVEPTKAPEPADTSTFEIPEVVAGKFNVAWVLIGPHDDGGWSQAHYEGIEYVKKMMPDVHTAYIENVPEGADSEQVFRALSRKGFNLIFGTSFGFMDPMETVAAEFPDITYIHISGYKSNGKNFGNLFGAMESMKYLAGMLAGARARRDGNPKLGLHGHFPDPGRTAPGKCLCAGYAQDLPRMHHGCALDQYLARSGRKNAKQPPPCLMPARRSSSPALIPPPMRMLPTEKGKWGITYDWSGSCKADRCLTAPYWNWGPIYARVVKGVQDKTYKVGWDYFDADTGGLGLYGFMEGQTPTKGVSEI